MPQALVAHRDSPTLMLLLDLLEQRGFSTRAAMSATQAVADLESSPALPLCICDLALDDAMRIVQAACAASVDVVVVTSDPESETTAEALAIGARDCIAEPLNRFKIDRALARVASASKTAPQPVESPIIGESPAMQRLAQTIERIGSSDVTVLIIGESGTGKELVASRLHALSARARGPYLALNCGAVTSTLIESELFGHERGSFTGASRQHAGYFERAHGGTLFLDEVTEMPLELQVRLLRVLETRCVSRVGSSDLIPVDVRVIAATNRDPHDAVRQGKLREDLLYRLQVVPLHVPPLRARAGDVRLLANYFLSQLNETGRTSKTFSESALARLESYPWPGNVRELYNMVQRAYILSEGRVITHPGVHRDVLPTASASAVAENGSIRIQIGESLANVEQRLILQTLLHCRTKDEAARLLGVSTKTLYNKLRRYQSEERGGSAQTMPAATAQPQGGDARIA